MIALSFSILIVILSAIGQIFLKNGANDSENIFLNKNVYFGYGIFLLVVFMSITLMNYVQLKYFSIIVSFTYPVTIILASVFLKEKISFSTLLACLVILFGCVVFNL